MSKVIVIMGVSGCGKTTVGKHLATQMGIPFYDADDFHPQTNIYKMVAGTPLTDTDRLPWLEHLSDEIKIWSEAEGAILACSALKEAYRIRLQQHKKVSWVYLAGEFDTIFNRMKIRNHFMKPGMLQSQFDTLEVPNYGMQFDVSLTVKEIVSRIMQGFTHE